MKHVLDLALKSLWHRRVPTILTIVSIALSVALFVGVGKTRDTTRDAFSGAISRVDLIVGPRTGTLSLLLYSVFHVGTPTHNVSMKAVEFTRSRPEVEWVVPFSMGDGYRGYPVIGTTPELFQRYKFRDGNSIVFKVGEPFKNDSEAVIGYDVASRLSVKMGDKLVLSHGHTEHGDGFEKHEEHPFTVTGILDFTGTPLDKSVFVSLVGMAEIHRELIEESAGSADHQDHAEDSHGDTHAQEHDHGHDHDHGSEGGSYELSDGFIKVNAVSGFFVGAKNRMDSLNLQRTLNTWEGDALLAILPGMAMAELWQNLSIFEMALSIISLAVVIAGILGLFVSLYIASGQRRHEMMVLRAVGAGPRTLLALLAGEAIFLVLAGIAFGGGVMYGGLALLSPWIEERFSITLSVTAPGGTDLIFALMLLLVGCIVGILASLKTYKTAMHEGLGSRF